MQNTSKIKLIRMKAAALTFGHCSPQHGYLESAGQCCSFQFQSCSAHFLYIILLSFRVAALKSRVAALTIYKSYALLQNCSLQIQSYSLNNMPFSSFVSKQNFCQTSAICLKNPLFPILLKYSKNNSKNIINDS